MKADQMKEQVRVAQRPDSMVGVALTEKKIVGRMGLRMG